MCHASDCPWHVTGRIGGERWQEEENEKQDVSRVDRYSYVAS